LRQLQTTKLHFMHSVPAPCYNTLSHEGPNILFGTLFSRILHSCFSLRVRDIKFHTENKVRP
jgi:hypothetical protein